ncbi:MAG: hypothetical protein Fur0043_12080 [Anaerolineales bacterium]
MLNLEFLLRVMLETLTLFVLLVGLAGLFIPVFPGLTIMWLATLVYALLQAGNGQMTWIDWTLFALITLLMIAGNVIDNILIAKHARDKQIPWSSILLGFLAGFVASLFFTPLVGIVASPLGLFGAEYLRLKDREAAMQSTRAWLTGWGFSVLARVGIGIFIVALWMAWAWL